ncbi:MAG: hypothetical protein JJ978_12760 [Roseivirga sp.]|uniref:hypothetical protein n=1 Tax=Roseivirga sp. TaxID=1964215 RepID=UPI001B0E24A6|nr:hypothetical protein [Roseivirga sp.]MBO6496434.1 hypothetical protein [Roseivirga sp.]
MKRRTQIFTALLAAVTFSMQSQDLKIGLLNKQPILEQMYNSQSTVNFHTIVDKEVKVQQEKIWENYQKQKNLLTQKIMASQSGNKNELINATLDSLNRATNAAMETLQTTAQNRVQRFYDQLLQKLDNAVATVVKEKKIKHVIPATTDQGEKVILYLDQQTSSAYNITADVAKLLGLTNHN